MKFEVNEVKIIEEEDGFKYYGIFNKDNKDWYEELKKFDKDTLKVMYNKDTHLVLSTNQDATMIAPTMAGDVVEEIEYQEVEIAPDNYFVAGKIVKLKECETIKDGKIVFNRDFKIEQIKKELSELKVEYSEKEFLYKGKYLQKNREKGDRDNLTGIVVLLMATGQKEYDGWKVLDKDTREHVYLKLSLDDLKIMALHMQEQVTKALKMESSLIAKLETLSDEELKLFNAREEFEKIWNS
nr:MAG TPA: tail fiber assembly protein [Caudoviricetes sp.]